MDRSILLVDDDIEIRLMLSILFQMEGWRVIEARDGVDALEKVAVSLPDAIVMDVMMPHMDGISVCRVLRDKPETSHIPIIMLSGKPTQGAIREGLQAGATAYLTKPPNLDELILCLNQLTKAVNGHSGKS